MATYVPNTCFIGAQELRVGAPSQDPSVARSADLTSNLPLEMAFSYLGIHLDDPKTAGKAMTLNFEVEGTDQRYAFSSQNQSACWLRVFAHIACLL